MKRKNETATVLADGGGLMNLALGTQWKGITSRSAMLCARARRSLDALRERRSDDGAARTS